MPDSIHVVCPRCRAANRVIKERLTQAPVCGKCGEKLLPAKPLTLTDATFERYIAKSGLPVLVDFWAPWCAPCRAMGPNFEQAAALLHPGVILAKLDTQDEQRTADAMRIQGVPTLVLFRNGSEIARVSGAMSANDLVNWTRSHL